jgi:alpha-beta hydrolase superfamily lysophospholipase
MLHGYGPYVGKFAFIAKKFSEQGYDFVGYDYPGFGLSEGPRGYVKDKEQFV